MRNIDDVKEELKNAAVSQERCRSIDLFPIGAPTKERAIELVRNFDDEIIDTITDDEYYSILEASWRSVRGPSRWVIAARNAKEMRQSVADFVLKDRCAASGTRHNTPRRVTFVFSGMGPQWGGMGRELAESLPRFAEHIKKIDALFVEHYGKSVWEELYKYKDEKQLPTDLAQTGNFLLQAAMYNLLVDEDIVPEAILGHSAGEVAAAYAAGVYTLEEGVRVAIARGTLQASLAGRGSMLAVGLSREEATEIIEGIEGVSIAAINDDKGVTLSGDSDEIEKIDSILQEKKTFSKMLRVEVPYHSPIMDEITDKITADLSFLKPGQAKIKLYSTVSGKQSDGPEWDGSYWARNIRQPVLFSDTLKLALNEDFNCFIEIAPHPVLSQSINSLSSDYSGISIHHLITRRDNEYETFVGSVSELAIDGIGRPKRRSSAPLFKPVTETKQLWDEHPDAESTRRGDLAVDGLSLLGRRIPGAIPSFDVEVSTTDYPWISGHTVQELGAIVPATMWAELIAMAASEGEKKSVRLTDLRIVASLPVSDNPTIISTKIEGGIAKCQSRALGTPTGWTLHAVASIASVAEIANEIDNTASADQPDKSQQPAAETAAKSITAETADSAAPESESHSQSVLPTTTGVRVNCDTLYQAFRMKGLNYAGAFKNLTDVVIEDGDEAWATIESPEPFEVGLHSPWVLDAGLQLLIAAAKDWGELMYLPFRIGNVNLHQTVMDAGEYQAHAAVSVRNEFELIGSVRFYDLSGKLLVELEDIACLRNFSDDAERLNYLDRNTYALTEFTPEEIAERFSEEEEEAEIVDEAISASVNQDEEAESTVDEGEEAAESQLEEYWITDENTALPFDRPRISLDAIDDKLEASLLWALPNSGDIQSDVLAATQIIQAVSKPDNSSLILTIIADQGQSWLSGLRRSACNAYRYTIRTIFVDDDTSAEMIEAAVALTDEHEIVFEGDEPLFRRLDKVTSEHLRSSDDVIAAEEGQLPASTLYFELAKGQLNKLVTFNEPLRELKEGEVCIEVEASALTWKDIGKAIGTIGTNVMNTFAGHHMGTGSVGVVIATGPNAPFSVGDTVYGPSQRSFRKHIVFDVDDVRYMRRVPDGVDNVTAITHVVPWITAFSIFEDNQPNPGDKVFVQSGAGGVGSIICRYLKSIGAYVVTSVGTESKVDAVKGLIPGIDEVIVARSEAIPNVLADAGHDGFDWIIATVSGPARAGLLSQLNMRGYYIDIGKPGSIDESLLASTFDGNKHYYMMDIDQLLANTDHSWMEEKLNKVLEAIVDPANRVPVTSYPVNKLTEAVTDMGRGETTGCIAITLPKDYSPPALNPPYTLMDPDGSYLITGGYGAVGLIIAQWLSSRGARHIVLSGSSGKLNETSQAAIDLLKAGGVEIQVVKNDASDSQSVMDMVRNLADSGRKIRGVIHAAGVIADGQFDDIGSDRIAASFGPKLEGAYHLFESLDAVDALDDLQFLLMTSSVSSVIGITIQGTYAAANAGLDGLAEDLRSIGINATAMQLGPIDSGGMASDDVVHRYLDSIGTGYVTPRRLCGILDLAVAANAPHFVTEEIDWAKNGRGLPGNITSSALRHIVQPALAGTGQADLDSLLALDLDDRTDVLTTTLLDIITSAIGVDKGDLNKDSNFSSMGVDSLAIMEVQAGVNEALQVDVPLARLFTQDGTIGLLAAQISEYLETNHKKAEESA